jgi:hypothetical protein
MKNWKNWILIPLFLLLMGGLWILHKKFPEEIVKVEIREDDRKIDSLMFIIGEKSSIIDSLKNQKEKIKVRVIEKVEKLKTLPPDSTIQIFYEGLQTYGEIESTKPILKEDSSIICSIDNLKGANIVTAKYEGKAEENVVLKKIVALNSGIIADKDSIICENLIIFEKTKNAYDTKLDELNQQLKKEIREKKVATYCGTFLAGILGGLLIFGK